MTSSGTLEATESRREARSAGRFSAATLASRLLGYARDALSASLFGAGTVSDAFIVAFRIPNLLRDLLAEGALSSAFIPTLSSYLGANRREEGLRLTQAVLTLAAAGLAVVVLAGILFAPAIVGAIAPGLEASSRALTITLARWLMPFIGFIGLAAIMMGFLNAHGRFGLPALAPALFNLVVLAVGYFACPLAGPDPERQVLVWTWGVLAASVLQWFVQVPSAWRHGFRPAWRWEPGSEGVRRVGRLMGPMIFANGVLYLNALVVNTHLASWMGPAVITYLNYGFRLLQLPMGLFGVAISAVALPALAREAGAMRDGGDVPTRFQDILARAMRRLLFWTLPSAAGLAVLSGPLSSLLFQRGRFTAADAAATGGMVAAYALGLVGLAGSKLLTQAFYALGNSRAPVRAGLATVGANLGLTLALMPWCGVWALPLGNSLAALLNFWLLWSLLRRTTGLTSLPGVGRLAAASAAGAGLLSAAVWAWLRVASGAPAQVAGGVGIGIMVYGGCAWVFRLEEVREVRRWLPWS